MTGTFPCLAASRCDFQYRISTRVHRLERSAEGTVLFDIDEGRVIESDIAFTLAVEIEMTVKNERTKKDETVKTKVTGTGSVVMKLQPAAPEVKEETPEGGAE